MKYLAVVPARGGSKRLPGKNLMLLAGRPLIVHTLDAAKAAQRLTAVVVSTDSAEIAACANSCGVDPQGLRPAHIARDDSPVIDALLDALGKYEQHHPPVDAVVLLQPTSPYRNAHHIDEAIRLFEATGADTVTAVRQSREHPYWSWRPDASTITPYFSWRELMTDRSQLPPALVENGSIFVIRRSVLQSGRIYGDKVVAYPMDDFASVDIDTPLDFEWAEFIAAHRVPTPGSA